MAAAYLRAIEERLRVFDARPTRFRVVQIGDSIYVEYKGWLFWRRVHALEGWKTFKSEADALEWIADRIGRQHHQKHRRVLYDTHD